MQQVDVCILGAGPGGSTAALHLANAGISSILLDKAFFPRDKICGDALSGKVVNELKRIDPALVKQLDTAAYGIPSWGIHFFAPNRYRLSIPFQYGYQKAVDPVPGYLVRRLDFDNFLIEEVRKRSQIDFREGVEVTDYRREDGRFVLLDKKGQELLATPLLLVANGAQSSFTRRVAGIDLEPNHYYAGIRTYYQNVSGLDTDGFVELHFLPDFLPGYLWIFPLSDGFANVGVGVRSDMVSRKKLNLNKALLETIHTHPQFKDRFSNAEPVGKTQGFGLPLGSKRRKLSGDNFMLLGDAASLIDPFSGEGIGHAMISGRWAAHHAAKALQNRNFSASSLQAYDQAIYNRLGKELALSYRMQQLLRYPWFFNTIAKRATRSPALSELLSCMFLDLDLRQRLKQPSFYAKLLLGR